MRKVKEGETTNDIFAFFTTEPHAMRPAHAKAMPVIPTAPDEIDQWMTAPAAEALKLRSARCPMKCCASTRAARGKTGRR